MAGGVAVLYVGANSEVEMKEKKDRVDDAPVSYTHLDVYKRQYQVYQRVRGGRV